MSHKFRTNVAIIFLFMTQNQLDDFKIATRMIVDHLKNNLWIIFRTSRAQLAGHSQKLESLGILSRFIAT